MKIRATKIKFRSEAPVCQGHPSAFDETKGIFLRDKKVVEVEVRNGVLMYETDGGRAFVPMSNVAYVLGEEIVPKPGKPSKG